MLLLFFFLETLPTKNNRQNSIYENERLLVKLLEANGVKGTLALLARDSGNGSKFDCHTQAHNIGRVGWKIFREKVFEEGSSLCHSGVYHGAMESFINQTGTSKLTAKIEELCNSFKTHFGVFQCVHGAGHGILAYLDYDLPNALIECQKFNESWRMTSCYDGVFMENIVVGRDARAGRAIHQTHWLSYDPQFPCNAIDNNRDIQLHCYRMQTSWMITLHDVNYDKVIGECLKSPKSSTAWCFRGLGRSIAGNTYRELSQINEVCQKVPDTLDYHQQCITGAVQVITDFWGQNLRNQASDLCKSVDGQKNKETCDLVLAERIDQIFNSK